jgi:hypothetical protein
MSYVVISVNKQLRFEYIQVNFLLVTVFKQFSPVKNSLE